VSGNVKRKVFWTAAIGEKIVLEAISKPLLHWLAAFEKR
jgi:hypothetical protein